MATLNLKASCINREGEEEGLDLYNQIIEDCKEALNNGECEEIEEILYDAGFEPDYIMDVLDVIS
jgi:hypothetical protein